MSILRTYPLKHYINKRKQDEILNIFKEYQKLALVIGDIQWDNFFKNGNFNKDIDIKNIKTPLSERYKQTCQYQVVGQLKSFVSNLKNKFKIYVRCSNLDENIKKDLYIINKLELWYSNSAIMLSDVKNKEYETIRLSTIKLSRKIFKRLLKINKKPNLKNINLALDFKVAKIKDKIETKKDNAKSFDYWIVLSSLEKGKTIKLPVNSNEYFNAQDGIRKNFIQINKDIQTNQLTICFIKQFKSKKNEYMSKVIEDSISIDLGLRNLFATNKGDLIGRNFITKLKYFDRKITRLQKELQKHKIKLNRNKRYRKLIKKVRGYIKNEVNRAINKIIKLYNPKEIIIERLNFKSPKLSKTLNRLLSKFGKGYITKKFNSIEEIYSIKITEINPAFTSQECSSCGNVDKNNRKTQKEFVCTFCGKRQNADISASVVIGSRSSTISIKDIYAKKAFILDNLLTKFIEQNLSHYSLASFRNRTKDNIYLLEHDFYQKNVIERLRLSSA